MRTPSISTSVWPRFAPRRNTPETEPGPPFCTISTPGCRCRSSVRLCAPARAISSGPMTVTSASTSAIGCASRAAVTATGSSFAGVCAVAYAAASVHRNEHAARCRARRIGSWNMANSARSRAIPARRRRRSGALRARPRTGRRPVSGLAGHGRPPSRPRTADSGVRGRPFAGLPLRGQPRTGAEAIRATPRSRFTRREGFAADTCAAILARDGPSRRRPAGRALL